MQTRFPFRYGIAAMVELPHLFMLVEGEVDGRPFQGLASEGLPPKWFAKNPDTTFEQDLPDLLNVIGNAVRLAEKIEGHSVFDWWWQLYHEQSEWAKQEKVPPLLAHLGTSLVERAVIDGVCRAYELSFSTALRENLLGIDLGRVHPELSETVPHDWLKNPLESVIARHTVGLGDPLTASEISAEDRASDQLPQALDDAIEVYGLTHFKVKVCGNPEKDIPRLKSLAKLFQEKVPGYLLTLDGNEQYDCVSDFKKQWEQYLAEPDLQGFLSPDHLIFVEQPIYRDHALTEEVREELAKWQDAPPMIIDESDAELGSARRALALGYRGTSHKNCKGVFKGLANRCFIEWHRKTKGSDGPWLMSGEDLANVGPVALLNDLAVMAALRIGDVERNGHHYFAGLSMYPVKLQQFICEEYPTLYQWNQREEFASLQIEKGTIQLGNLNTRGFGFTGALSRETLSLLGDEGMPS